MDLIPFARRRNNPVHSRQWVLVALSVSLTLSIAMATIRLPAPVPTSPIPVQQLTVGSWLNEDATFSPDGQTIAFASNQSGDFDIWTMNAQGRHQTRLTSMPGDETHPMFSPDGKKIAFLATTSGTTDICVIGTSGQGLTNLTDDDATEESFEWSPSGRLLAYDSNKGGRWNIWLTDLHGKKSQLTKNEGDNKYPTWKHDESMIAFVQESDKDNQIWIAPVDGGRTSQITWTNGKHRFPDFNPRLNQVAYLADTSGWWSIWIADLDNNRVYDVFARQPVSNVPAETEVQFQTPPTYCIDSCVDQNTRIKWDLRGVTILFAAKSTLGWDEVYVVMPKKALFAEWSREWGWVKIPLFTKLALDSGSRLVSIEWGRDWKEVLVSTSDEGTCKVLLLQYDAQEEGKEEVVTATATEEEVTTTTTTSTTTTGGGGGGY